MSRGNHMSSRAPARDLVARGARSTSPHTRPGSSLTLGMTAVLLLLALVSCRQKMSNQPRYDPLEPSAFFQDGMSARPRIPGTVARGELSIDPFLETGKVGNAVADGFPFAITEAVIDRGHERFDIYCSECHGRTGDGNGMIPSRGYRRPPSFHTETLRTAKTGHFFDVMTNGFGAMPPYKTMIPPRDRWAIVAYIKALQLSQNATVNDVPPAERAKLDQPVTEAQPEHGGGH
jgi:mono/diheme cytochrome c family protein